MPKNKPLRVIIDTNIWISFIISKKLTLLDEHIFSGKIRILLNENLLSEIKTTIEKPKLQKYFLTQGLEKMLNAFDSFIDLIEIKSSISVCRDPKDDFLLSLAMDGKADYLIIGDKDLLDLGKFRKTKILTVTDFLNQLGGNFSALT
ncbi:putative toxin-antitoxin system toxin component, PIN family [Cognataquiflexum rubidum]|uniref:putative toxin-antitoxin system toxin component, PIN family n=1 Tax=Cognataquiflexum rubidum TaxID=2922273 RepID=UPI001F12D7DD|nr:putative toxin-antitoxin system toxin component, PIN family [Cognataquiflexum rubidum]MCH6234074.1 putative toxin-antitoxin system toxin component, PIN family [Cognataquiflexum rubidum]